MNEASILDIISPVMVGPSSSHTAGAVKIGLLARNIYGNDIDEVKITLFNSYAQTGSGHGTDKGIIAGLLGFGVDNVIIKDVFNSWEASKIKYHFDYQESFTHHPNAVEFEFSGCLDMKICAKSVGGGEVEVYKIDNFDVNLNGNYNTLIIVLNDTIGVISKITGIIQKHNINIAQLNCDRKSKGSISSCCLCLDGEANEEMLDEIKYQISPHLIRYIKKLNK